MILSTRHTDGGDSCFVQIAEVLLKLSGVQAS